MLGEGYSPITVIPARDLQGACRLAQTARGLQQPQETPESAGVLAARTSIFLHLFSGKTEQGSLPDRCSYKTAVHA